MDTKVLARYKRLLANMDKILSAHAEGLITPHKDSSYQAMVKARFAIADELARYKRNK